MSRAATGTANIPYKELQKLAKRYNIPANMKRSFLELAINATVDGDREQLDSIVEYHKSQRKRRANASNHETKDAGDYVESHASEAKKSRVVAVTAAAASPMRASSFASSGEHFNYKLSDDDDSSNFHPDSTSTPNRSSSIVNLRHYAKGCPNTGGGSRYTSADDFRLPRDLSYQFEFYDVPSTLVSTRIRTSKEMSFNGKDGATCSTNGGGIDRDHSIRRATQSPTMTMTAAAAASSQPSVYDDTNVVADAAINADFVRHDHRQYQHRYQYHQYHHHHRQLPFRTAYANMRYLETKAADTIIPVSATYERASVVVDVENLSNMSRVIEKQRSSYSSYCSGNVALYSKEIGTRKNEILPEASSLRSSSDAFVDNFRPIPTVGVDYASSVVRSQLSDRVNGNTADAESVNAEFDSDSDTETFSLTDEIFDFFDSRAPVENGANRLIASNALTPPPPVLNPIPVATPAPAPMPFFSISNSTDGSSPILRHLSVFGNCNQPPTWNGYDTDYRPNTGGGDTTNLWLSQPVLASSSSSSANIAVGGYNALPSISTLLPEYKTRAYCQGYWSSEARQQSHELAEQLNAYAPVPITNGNDDGITAAAISQQEKESNSHPPPPPPRCANDRCDANVSHASAFFRRSCAATENEAKFLVIGVDANSGPPHLYSPDEPESRFAAVKSSVSCPPIAEWPPAPAPASSSYNSRPFDVFAETVMEMRKCDRPAANVAAATVDSRNRWVSKTRESALCEASLKQRTTSLVLKHETISIRGLATDDRTTTTTTTTTTQDFRCESLEMKTDKSGGGGVEERTTASPTAVHRNATYAPLVPISNGTFRTNVATAAAAFCARSFTSNATTTTTTNKLVDGESVVSTYRPCRCRNETYGCNVITSEQESARMHEKECLHRVVRCPSDKCNWCGVVRTLSDHVYLCHKSDLNVGNDLVYVINRSEKDSPFVTYFQLHQGTIFVITLHVNGKKCIATMRYLPEIETADYKNKSVEGTMQLVYFTSRVETRCWKGVVRPYFEDDKTLYETGNVLQSGISNSKNVVIRTLIE